MVGIETPGTAVLKSPEDRGYRVKILRARQDEILHRLHVLTRSRDAGEVLFPESLPMEQSLVAELGQIQDRLHLIGSHGYDGCLECRPRNDKAFAPTERNDHGR